MIYFKELARSRSTHCGVSVSSKFDWGEASGLKTHERISVQVQSQPTGGQGRADVADEVQRLLGESPLALGRSAFCSSQTFN